MKNLFNYINVTSPSSRKRIEEFNKKYKVIEASFFSAQISDTALVDEMDPILLTPKKMSLVNNFSSDVYDVELEKYKSKLKLNIKMDVPLSDIKFNEDVFSYYNDRNESDNSSNDESDDEEDIEKLRDDFEAGIIQKLDVYNRTPNDFDEGKATSTVTFPKKFPLFDNNNSKTFVIYEGQISYKYYRNDISDVEKSQDYEFLYQKSQLETLEKLRKNIRELEERIISSGNKIKDKKNYEKSKKKLEKKVEDLQKEIDAKPNIDKLKYLSFYQVEENVNKIAAKGDSKDLEEYLSIFNTEFYVLLYVGENSFITLRLKKLEDKNLKRKNDDINVGASTSKKK